MQKNNRINHREALGFWLNEFKLTGAGAEVGCAFGGFSRTVLSQWKGENYWMIDPWKSQAPDEYRERQEPPERYEKWWEEVNDLASRDRRVHLIRKLSVDAAKDFQDNSLDFVYIDGNHDYVHVLQDLDAWWPKVKHGGLLSGHDFITKTDEGWFCEVDQAVTRWCREKGLVFYVTPCCSWWCPKE